MARQVATKKFPGGETTVTILDSNSGFRVTVIHRFASGNFIKEYDRGILSWEAAQGILKFYTS